MVIPERRADIGMTRAVNEILIFLKQGGSHHGATRMMQQINLSQVVQNRILTGQAVFRKTTRIKNAASVRSQ